MDDQKYNGWHNYATWRVQLELVDGEIRNMIDNDPDYFKGKEPHEVAEEIKDLVYEIISDNSGSELVTGWAWAFCEDVDWLELAEAAMETAKETVRTI